MFCANLREVIIGSWTKGRLSTLESLIEYREKYFSG